MATEPVIPHNSMQMQVPVSGYQIGQRPSEQTVLERSPLSIFVFIHPGGTVWQDPGV